MLCTRVIITCDVVVEVVGLKYNASSYNAFESRVSRNCHQLLLELLIKTIKCH